ncbi:hypothetical protein LRH25_07160 [Ideonella azotifigens]|uniref:Holin-X, holin superfamily III n=1 Tax=Ideonella azotifigens TaxID=513160 RepID=A0ABN1JPX3_9BURK|nr:hypothetical protein [Ideonella azotifigens]MCD2340120.1 hypothetical protein [Ideonella azotifigens]
MLPPLVSRLVSDPSLAIEHARRYAALTEAELAYAGQYWQRRAVAAVAAAVLLGVGLMLGGVALLVAQGPGAQAGWQASWLFWAVPLVPLALGVLAAFIAAGSVQPTPFATLRAQLAQDAALLLPATAQTAAQAMANSAVAQSPEPVGEPAFSPPSSASSAPAREAEPS